jgi:tRNA pseudouridine55 synthase
MRLGEETTTGDLTGEVVTKGSLKGVTSETVHVLFKTFQGRIQQTPPMFSAVKVRGKPLYRLARKGIEIERKTREIEIFDIEVIVDE